MATAMNSYVTMLELGNRSNNKQLLEITQNLVEENAIIGDMILTTANQKDRHVFTRQGSLPAAQLRGANQGITPSAAQTDPGYAPISRFEDRNEIDEAIVDLAGESKEEKQQFRFDEASMHMEGVAQGIANKIIYGKNADDEKEFDGLATLLNATSNTMVEDNGCSDSNAVTSAYVVQWGKGKVYGVIPKGSVDLSGKSKKNNFIVMKDKGLEWRNTNASDPSEGLYKWITQIYAWIGLVPQNLKCVGRVCNIGTDGADEIDIDKLMWVCEQLPSSGKGAVIYVPRLVKHQIRKAAATKPNAFYTDKDPFGKLIDYFYEWPIRIVEQISLTEAVVS